MKPGFPLWLTLLLAGLGLRESIPAADVSYYGIIKSQTYSQSAGGSAAALASNGFSFTAIVLGASNNLVLGAAVKPPNPTPLRLLTNLLSQALWQFIASADTSSALDALYPGGTASYTLTVQTANDGVKTTPLSFFLISAPPVPQLANLPAAQDINSAADFTLQWGSLGGSSVDIVQLTLLDGASNVVFSTPAPFQTGALTGGSSAIVVPAHSLPPGTAFTGYLTIGRPGLPNLAYATGIAALAKTTTFQIRTRPLAPPRLTVLPRSDAAFAFRLSGESNVNYEIQTSSNLANWSVRLTTNSARGVIDLSDPRAPGPGNGFYRARGVR